jgi:TPR repeat protein
MRYLSAITLLILTLAIMPPVNAQSFKPDYKAGRDAHMQKDYATALRHYRPLAKQGDAQALLELALMYKYSEGVLQDRVMAYVMFSLSAAHGVRESLRGRDQIGSELTASELKLARKLSKLCLKKPAECPEYSDD